MPLITADIQTEYAKNKQLKEADVKALLQWAEAQPHLPCITELHAILFLQSCYFSIESAKSAIDVFYTARTLCSEIFTNRDPYKNQQHMEIAVYAPLPKLTHDNNRVMFCKIMDSDWSKYSFSDQFKIFDMSMMLCLLEHGTADGLIIVFDIQMVRLGHLTKLGILTMKKLLYYLQEALPVRLLGLHFINVVPFMDKILALMKPFIKKELMDVLYLHTDCLETLNKYVPVECLPQDYGGTADSTGDLQRNTIKKLHANADYFKAEEMMVVDESKRPGKPKDAGEVFGVEGTFKKLDID